MNFAKTREIDAIKQFFLTKIAKPMKFLLDFTIFIIFSGGGSFL